MAHVHKAFDPARSGYRILYHKDHTNHCPGCGQAQWIVGRSTAECAFCATAIPLDDSRSMGNGLFTSTIAPSGRSEAWAA